MPRSSQPKTVQKHQLVAIYRQAVAAGVPVEVVHQKIQTFADRSHVALRVEEQDDKKRLKKLQKQASLKTRLLVHILPIGCVVLGLFLVSNAIWPILSYFAFTSPELLKNSLQAPIPNAMILNPLVHSIQAQASSGEEQPSPEPVIMADDLDYTNLNNWFPNLTPSQAAQLSHTEVPKNGSTEYILDVPAVNIQNARVKIGGSDLDKSLIQYPGTAMPGDPGSPVIFGHSVLRQFYNPGEKNPRRYMSIFSKIMTLTPGDKIFITRDGVRFTYIVESKTEVTPDETFILEQNFDNKILKMVTCVPEGTTLRRGVLTSRLVQE